MSKKIILVILSIPFYLEHITSCSISKYLELVPFQLQGLTIEISSIPFLYKKKLELRPLKRLFGFAPFHPFSNGASSFQFLPKMEVVLAHCISKISDILILAVYLVNFVEHLQSNGKS